jgi:hypothetical protein
MILHFSTLIDSDPRFQHFPPKFSPLSLSLKNLLPPFPANLLLFRRSDLPPFSSVDRKSTHLHRRPSSPHFRGRPAISARLHRYQALHFLRRSSFQTVSKVSTSFSNWFEYCSGLSMMGLWWSFVFIFQLLVEKNKILLLLASFF